MNWYELLIKPPYTPPAWVFAPAWIFLYILIGVSFVLFLKTGNIRQKLFPVGIFALQLFLNLIWSPIFFGFKNIGLALLIICILWGVLLINIFQFYKYSKLAAYLLLPYFCWVSFATYLNAGIYFLN